MIISIPPVEGSLYQDIDQKFFPVFTETSVSYLLYHRFCRIIWLHYITFQLFYGFSQLHGFTRTFWRHFTPSRCGPQCRVRGGPSVWRVGGGAENACFFDLVDSVFAQMFQTRFSLSGNMLADTVSLVTKKISNRTL